MRAITRRLCRLEDQIGLAGKPRRRFRLVVSLAKPLNLATSTCQRRLSPDGLLTEIVRLDGSRDGLTDEELEKFIERFPVEGSI